MRRARVLSAASVVAGLVVGLVAGSVLAPGPASAALAATAHVSSVLNVRSAPATTASSVRTVRNGAALAISCQVHGQTVHGSVRTTDVWDRLTDGNYVADAYVSWRGGRPNVAWCAVRAVVHVVSLLNQRVNASTLLPAAGTLRSGTGAFVACQLYGESVAGSVTTSSVWDRLTSGRFAADAYLAWPGRRPSVPWCTTGATTPPAAGAAFIAWALPYARASMHTYHVPAAVTLAQAILESGWGRSALTANGNAYFGMKCFGTPGRIALGCRPFMTTECANTCYLTMANFRIYPSVAASFSDHGFQLATLARYQTAMRYPRNPNQFAIELQRAGYATSPTYASKLIALMQKYNLYRYDG